MSRTLAHATSWDVDRAHCVAAAMTRFWSTVSSATWATFLAFSTNMAAALATALARFIRMSYDSTNRWQRWKQSKVSKQHYCRHMLSYDICFYHILIIGGKMLRDWHLHRADKGSIIIQYNSMFRDYVCNWVLLHSDGRLGFHTSHTWNEGTTQLIWFYQEKQHFCLFVYHKNRNLAKPAQSTHYYGITVKDWNLLRDRQVEETRGDMLSV